MAVKPFELEPCDGPPMVQACSMALEVLKLANLDTWHALALAIRASNVEVLGRLEPLQVTPEQNDQLVRFAPVLSTLVRKPKATRTVAVCPECGGWFWTMTRVPTKCPIGWQCTGKPVRASAAKRRYLVDEPTPVEPAQAEPDTEQAGLPMDPDVRSQDAPQEPDSAPRDTWDEPDRWPDPADYPDEDAEVEDAW